MKIALLVAYDGSKFHGFAKQPGVDTIEGVILRAINELGLSINKIQYMSRTDKGVHALHQVITISKVSTIKIGHLLNEALPECVRVHAVSRVRHDFNPRRSVVSKTYLYVAPYQGEDLGRIRWVVDYINAKEHDFTALIKRRRGVNYGTKMKLKVKVTLRSDMIYFFVTSKYFLWEQVRRLITLIKAYSLKRITKNEFIQVLMGQDLKWGIAPAPPGGLILWRAKIKGVNGWIRIIPKEIIERWVLDTATWEAILSVNRWVLPPKRRIKTL